MNLSSGSGALVDLEGTATQFAGHDGISRDGTPDPLGDSKKVMFDFPIGGSLALQMFLRTTDGSSANGVAAVDCDSQAALLWTLDLPADATLVNLSNPGEDSPVNGSATPQDAVAAVPPRPDDVVPEPGAGASVCLGGVLVAGGAAAAGVRSEGSQVRPRLARVSEMSDLLG